MEPKRLRPESLEKEEKVEEEAASKKEQLLVKQPKGMRIGGNFVAKDIKFEHKLDRKYFRQEVVDLSKSLLGKLFVRETPKGVMKAVIVETEAYKAPLDKACHAYNSTHRYMQIRRLKRQSTSGSTGDLSTYTPSICLRMFALMWSQGWKVSQRLC